MGCLSAPLKRTNFSHFDITFRGPHLWNNFFFTHAISLSTTQLLDRMRKQGAKLNKLKLVLNKFFGRHTDDFSHDALSFSESILMGY